MQRGDVMDGEIFVFGSNLAGRHGAGAAKYAAQHYGAVYGVGEGRTGNAYAIPTKDKYLKTMHIDDVRDAIARFCRYAECHPEYRFLLTPVGTGLAGFPIALIWDAFYCSGLPKNVALASSWITDSGTYRLQSGVA